MPGKSNNTLLRLYGSLEPWFDKIWSRVILNSSSNFTGTFHEFIQVEMGVLSFSAVCSPVAGMITQKRPPG